MRAFWRRGYTATSVDDLVTAMGINRSSMYHAFGGKPRLFLAALRRYEEQVVDVMLGELETSEEGVAALRRFFARLVSYLASPEGCHGCLVTNSATELAVHAPGARKAIRRLIGRMERAFYGALARAVARREIAPHAPIRDLARHLTSVAQGMQVIARIAPGAPYLQSLARSALGVVRAG